MVSPPREEHGCSPWLCMENSPLTACFFSSNVHHDDAMDDDKAVVANSKSGDDDDDIINVMDIDTVLYEHSVEVSLDEYFLDVRDDDDVPALSKEEAQLKFQERMKIARQLQLQRFLRQQREAQARMAAKAKAQRRRVSQKNAEERKKIQEPGSARLKESGYASLDAAMEENARLAGSPVQVKKPDAVEKGDDIQITNVEIEEALQGTNKENERTAKPTAPGYEEEPAPVAVKKDHKEELEEKSSQASIQQGKTLRPAKNVREETGGREEQLAAKQPDEELGEAEKKRREEEEEEEKKEDEKAQKAAEAKEARRLAREKAAEAEERMRKAREEQRKLHQKQHQESIRKNTEKAKEARRLAAQEKREHQKRAEEEEQARQLSEEKACTQRWREQLESTKKQREAWQSQQAAATAAQREEWQKIWHTKHEVQHPGNASYHASQQQVPPPSSPPAQSWHPASPPASNFQGSPGFHYQYQPQMATPTSAAPRQQWQGTKTTPSTPPPPIQPSVPPKQAPTYQPHQPAATPSPPSPGPSVGGGSDMVNDDDQQETFTRIKRDVLTGWALQPPAFQVLRPVNELVTSIHTVFPSNHGYFGKWCPITNVSSDNLLKKSVRKIRFFLHPDKLPKDLNEEQLFLCKLLWDVTNDAWEEHTKAKVELDWIQ